jgi:hypothetical protein
MVAYTSHSEKIAESRPYIQLVNILQNVQDADFLLASIRRNSSGKPDVRSLSINEKAWKQFLHAVPTDFLALVKKMAPRAGVHRVRIGDQLFWLQVIEGKDDTIRLIYPRMLFGEAWGTFCLWSEGAEPLHDESQSQCSDVERKPAAELSGGWQVVEAGGFRLVAPRSPGAVVREAGWIPWVVGVFAIALGYLAAMWIVQRRQYIYASLVASGRGMSSHLPSPSERWFGEPPGFRIVRKPSDVSSFYFWVSYFGHTLIVMLSDSGHSEEERGRTWSMFAGGLSVLEKLLQTTGRQGIRLKTLQVILEGLAFGSLKKMFGFLFISSDGKIEYSGYSLFTPRKQSETSRWEPSNSELDQDNLGSQVEWTSTISGNDVVVVDGLGYEIQKV